MTDPRCPVCQAPAQDAARFCPSCGTQLDAGAGPVEIRKTVTALFCDVSGSTSLGQQLDPESLRSLMEQYFSAASAVVSHHGGTVEKFVGDAVMAVFGVPVVHEDDALRACRAALALLDAAERLDRDVAPSFGVRFAVRLGVESGKVLVGDQRRMSTFATGPAINVAARLEQAARPGECLLGPRCHELVRGQVEVGHPVDLVLAGVQEPIRAVRLVGAVAPEDAGARPVRTPLVGRARELVLLRQAFDRSAADRTCQLVTVLGPAGVGKTRLVNELIAELEPMATVLRGRCLAYGDGVTYWPLVDVVRQAAGLTGAEGEAPARARLAALVAGHPEAAEIVAGIAPIAGLGGTPTSVQDSSWAFQRLLESMAAVRPVALVLDDLHWAEPRLLDIVEWVCDWSREAPIFVLGLARPELLDARPAWSAGRVNAMSAMLEPLDEQEADALVTALLGGGLPPALGDSVRAAAGGNPLFVEQLIGMLVEDGVLHRDGSAWTASDDAAPLLRIPPTITALLAARLDRLTAGERAVLGPAAVVGDVFYRDAVTELSDKGAVEVAEWLRSLVRKNLVLPARSDLPGQDALRFRHTLVKDAAYESLPKSVRAHLHERFARWLGTRAEGSAYDDLVGSHLEAAYLLRADLGSLDGATVALGVEGAAALVAAGQSLLHADAPAAAALLTRALRLQPVPGPARWAVQLDLADALNQALDLTASERVADEVRVEAAAAADALWEALARVTLWSVVLSVRPSGALPQLRRATKDAARLLENSSDDVQLTRLYVGISDFAYNEMHSAAIGQALERAATHAERSGRARYAQVLRGQALLPLMNGDCPAERGLAESRRFADGASGLLPRASGAMGVAFFATLLGIRDEARIAAALVEDVVTEVRTLHAVINQAFTVSSEIAAGDPSEAGRILDRAAQRLTEVGESSYLSTILALRAHIYLTGGVADRTRATALRALELGGPDDILTRAHAEAALAWLAAHDGDADEARRLVAGSAALLVQGDGLMDRALVHVAAAETMLVLGDVSSSRRHRLSAIELYRAKGSPVAVARQEALLPT